MKGEVEVDFISLTQSNWFIIGPVAWVLGQIMNGIYLFLDLLTIPNIGISIILFTVIMKLIMLPMSIKQQKFSKLNSVMAPELQVINDKYKNKNDNESLMKKQAEMKEVYQKYGTSPTGGCLQMLIQLPVMFALYQVIYKIPGYVPKIKAIYQPIVDAMVGIKDYAANGELATLATQNGINIEEVGENLNKAVDMMYNFEPSEWDKFKEIFPQLTNLVNEALPSIEKINYFLGMDLTINPMNQLWPAIFVPILAGLTQFLSTKMTSATAPAQNSDNPTASTMKTMNMVMPLMSVFFCFTFPTGIGVYWVASSTVQIIVQLIVNKHMERVDINEMIAKNLEKENAKRAKRGLPPQKAKPVMNVKTIEEQEELRKQKKEEAKERSAQQIEKSSEYYSSTNQKKGKLASKASMVQQYNDKNTKNNKK